VAAPFREAEFDIVYGEGISREGDLIDLGVEKGVLGEERHVDQLWRRTHGQGRENARVFLKENKDIRDKLENVLRKKMEIRCRASRMRQRPDQMAMLLRHKGQKRRMEGFAAIAGVTRPRRDRLVKHFKSIIILQGIRSCRCPFRLAR